MASHGGSDTELVALPSALPSAHPHSPLPNVPEDEALPDPVLPAAAPPRVPAPQDSERQDRRARHEQALRQRKEYEEAASTMGGRIAMAKTRAVPRCKPAFPQMPVWLEALFCLVLFALMQGLLAALTVASFVAGLAAALILSSAFVGMSFCFKPIFVARPIALTGIATAVAGAIAVVFLAEYLDLKDDTAVRGISVQEASEHPDARLFYFTDGVVVDQQFQDPVPLDDAAAEDNSDPLIICAAPVVPTTNRTEAALWDVFENPVKLIAVCVTSHESCDDIDDTPCGREWRRVALGGVRVEKRIQEPLEEAMRLPVGLNPTYVTWESPKELMDEFVDLLTYAYLGGALLIIFLYTCVPLLCLGCFIGTKFDAWHECDCCCPAHRGKMDSNDDSEAYDRVQIDCKGFDKNDGPLCIFVC